MNYKIDPRFQATGKKSKARQAQRKRQRLALGGGLGVLGLVLIGGLVWGGITLFSGGDSQTAAQKSDPGEGVQPSSDSAENLDGAPQDDDFTMVQMAATAEEDALAVRAPFIDLAKDPMILHFESSGRESRKTLPGPAELPGARLGPAGPDRLTLIRDDLLLRETQIVTRIPSSRADLAYFQASRSRGITQLLDGDDPAATPAATGEAVDAGELVSVDGAEGSWGALIGGADGVEPDTATFVETRIENTTSVAVSLRESERRAVFEDTIKVLRAPQTLGEIVQSTGVDAAGAGRVETAAKRLLGIDPQLTAGHVVALRTTTDVAGTILSQMTLYKDDAYVGTLAQVGAGRFATGADPWIDQDLIAQGQTLAPVQTQQQVRLLDALYSAAIRNGLPTSLVGELIVMMSQAHDLDRFAAVGDRLTLLMASAPPKGQGNGQFLFVGINGPSGKLECYVIPDGKNGGFGCYRAGAGGIGGGAGSSTGRMGGGLLVPVNGTKTSDFGPRMHPILRQLRNHNGVDWAAPTGTPILAAAAGKIAVAGNGGGYGNVVYIDHSGGRQTRYAHLHKFGEGIRAGVEVQAGQLIGYVGTTGRSTGPHLHFELRVHGKPVDPLTAPAPAPGAPAGSGGAIMAGGASDAVEALVDQIIRVESGGRADAANPNSTAVGLGQFIKSTWLRMMRTYRPDLVASMSERDLLALRLNPELSREMVRNLAREGEAYLRARGHQITPGRLYLAHFLGAGGAHKALSADPNLSVAAVMGAGVVNANGFLRGKTIADLWAWSDRKMNRRGKSTIRITRSAPPPVPPEVRKFISAVEPIVKEDA